MIAFASEEQHNNQVEDLKRNPGKIIIGDTESLEGRISMHCSPTFVNKKGRIIGTPDGMLFDRYGNIIVYEYKTAGHHKKAVEQLVKYASMIQRQFGERPRLLYITGGLDGNPYKTKEVRL